MSVVGQMTENEGRVIRQDIVVEYDVKQTLLLQIRQQFCRNYDRRSIDNAPKQCPLG
jgi:hypothetical protein